HIVGPIMGSMSLSPDGKTLVLYGTEFAPRFIDLTSGAEVANLAGHGMPVLSVRFTPDSKRLMTYTINPAVGRWDALTGKDLGLLPLPSQATQVTASSDGK